MTLKLSDGQQDACEKLIRWWQDDPFSQPFRLDGYAGTGKTTVVEYALKALNLPPHEVKLLAPTGKAARVLSDRTGFEAQTIHKELYQPRESEEVIDLKAQLKQAASEEERQQIRRQLAHHERKGNSVSFTAKDGGTDASLLVIDEASMINEHLADDLYKLRTPLLLLGDPGQLPPVKGKGGFDDVTAAATLTEILRQDEGSTILEAADLVRRGEELPLECDWGAFKRVARRELSDADYALYDMVLCGTHKIRKAFNRRLRRQHLPDLDDQGPGGWLPQENDQLVCRANDYRRGTLNGQLLTAASDAFEEDDQTIIMDVDVQGDGGADLYGQTVNALRFKDHYLRNVAVHRVDRTLELDFAYALTVHSAQGSEWSRIVVLNDWRGSHYRRWLYTALTRGADEVVLVG